MRSGNLKRGFPLFAFCSIITNIWRYCMEFFQVTEKVIYFRNEGELLKIEGWGKNSLRVQSSLMIRSHPVNLLCCLRKTGM